MHYSILALSRNRAHLLDVTNGEVEAVNVPGMPGSLAEAWEGMEHTEESLQSHSAGNGTAMFHGQGNAKDESEMEADAYVQKVAKSLHTIIQERHLPLVFAGVEELYGLYKKHDTTGLLLEDYVKGNPDHLDVEHLLAHADPIIKAAADKRTAAILESYGNVAGTGKTLTDLGDILDAAASGKVDTLLVAEGAEQWGTFDPASSKKELHEASDGTNEELLGLAAMHTLRHRGQVVTVAADQMPEGKQIAAIVRF